jgi:hypothetical protein
MIITQIILFFISILWVIIKIIIFITKIIIFLILTLWVIREIIIFITHYYIKKTEEYLQHKLFGSWRGPCELGLEVGPIRLGSCARPIVIRSCVGPIAWGPAQDLVTPRSGSQAPGVRSPSGRDSSMALGSCRLQPHFMPPLNSAVHSEITHNLQYLRYSVEQCNPQWINSQWTVAVKHWSILVIVNNNNNNNILYSQEKSYVFSMWDK